MGNSVLLLAGYSGVGKSTAVRLLEKHGVAIGYYAGSVLADELAASGIKSTPENERTVREELRRDHGMAVFAIRSIPRILDLAFSSNVVVDAVYCLEELDAYRATFGEALHTIGISSELDRRSMRLTRRIDRPLEPEALSKRDQFERHRLGLDKVLAQASHSVTNNGSLAEFAKALNSFASAAFLRNPPPPNLTTKMR